MTPPADDDAGVTGALRRAVGAAYDATVGRVGEAALEITDNTARQVIEELEPYLIEEAIPRILEGLTPYLETELVPEVVDALVPHINASVAPEIIEAVTPLIIDEVAPKVVKAMLPMIVDDVAPQVIEGVMPQIIDEVAPQVIEGVLPMIRTQVVPVIMEDIVDDPRVRTLIREQSQGLILDAMERARRGLARADDAVEGAVRWLTRRGPRPLPTAGQTPAPVGRRYPYAGFVTRGVALTFDLAVVSFIVGAGVTIINGLLNSWFGGVPTWFALGLSVIAISVAPTYLALCWVWFGQSVGDAIFGVRLSRLAGGRMHLIPALIKAFVGILTLPVWVMGMITSAFNAKRQGLLDIFSRTESTYVSREIWQPAPDEDAPVAPVVATGSLAGVSSPATAPLGGIAATEPDGSATATK